MTQHKLKPKQTTKSKLVFLYDKYDLTQTEASSQNSPLTVTPIVINRTLIIIIIIIIDQLYDIRI